MDKLIKIVVNGREVEVEKKELLAFAEIVVLAFGAAAAGGATIYTITYKRGHGDKPEGILVEGATVKVKEGMIFNVTRTDKS